MIIMEKYSFEEGKISKIVADESALTITIKQWNNKELILIVKDYMRVYDYNCIGREISEYKILVDSTLLEEEKKEMKLIGYSEKEYINLIHLQFLSYDDLLLLDLIANKDSIVIT
ncbi:hypothetical protein [Paenibacillus wulumuqiensis]|uniref:hypothetical protein n=1 Tax=Paenibacillus wulumuqiensis TaxID=1567107 RepID=UPI000619308B|nr:hypothetical protein [Paenibacillus wulumuqiensis]